MKTSIIKGTVRKCELFLYISHLCVVSIVQYHTHTVLGVISVEEQCLCVHALYVYVTVWTEHMLSDLVRWFRNHSGCSGFHSCTF